MNIIRVLYTVLLFKKKIQEKIVELNAHLFVADFWLLFRYTCLNV